MTDSDKKDPASFKFNYYRAQLYNPFTKRAIYANYNLNKMTLEEAKEKAKEWRDLKIKEFEDMKQKLENGLNLKVCEPSIELDEHSGVSLMLLGSTKSGKSTCLNWLMDRYFYKKENKFINVLFSYSFHNPTYDDFRKHKNTVGSILYQPKIIKECYEINKNTKNHYKFNFIIDDVIDQKNDKQLKNLLCIYRNSMMSCIICAQNITIMNSIGRGNINYIFLFYFNSDEAIERAVKTYLTSYFPRTYKMIDKIRKYKELTKNHHFFCIDNITGKISLCKIKL